MKTSYLQNIVDTIRLLPNNHAHLPYTRRPQDALTKRLLRYYRRAHGSKDLFIDLGAMGVKERVYHSSRYGKKRREAIEQHGLFYTPARKSKVGRRIITIDKGPTNIYMVLRSISSKYVPVIPDSTIPKWDRVEFIRNHGLLTVQAYNGTSAPTIVEFTRASKDRDRAQFEKDWQSFEFYNPHKQEMCKVLGRRFPFTE